MLSSSRLQNSKSCALAVRPRIRTSPRERADFSPRLEALEHRRLFSTLTVTSDQDSGAGSLRATVAAAQSGDTIVFSVTASSSTSTSSTSTSSTQTGSSPGQRRGKKKTPPPPTPTPTPTPTITLTSGQLLLSKNLTIQGPGAGQLAIRGSGSRAFEVAQGSAITLSGLTVSGSSDYWAGYPVATPWAGHGGGILNHGTLAASGCTFGGLITGHGEGGAIFSDGTLSFSGCTISGGYAQGSDTSGAGISNWGTATLTNTIISNNAAQPGTLSYPWFNKGGGILNNGTMTLNGCTVSNNSARHAGGGIFNAGTLLLSGSTVSNNSASFYGFNVYNAGTMTVRNHSTIYGTLYAPDYGTGDVHNDGVLNLDTTSSIGTLAGNRAILI